MSERQYSNETSSLSTLSCFTSIYLGKKIQRNIYLEEKNVTCSMLKMLQARLQQYVNREFPDVQAEFRKGRGTRDQIANICWIIKKSKKSSRKISTSALSTMPKPLTVWIT